MKCCFSLLPTDLGTFATGKQKGQGGAARRCHLQSHPHGHRGAPAGAEPSPFLGACRLPRTQTALLLCRAELGLLEARGQMGQAWPWAPPVTPAHPWQRADAAAQLGDFFCHTS